MPSFICARWIAELRLIYDVIKCKITCIPQTAYALKNINGCAPADDKLLAVYNYILIPIPCMVMESVLLSKICSSLLAGTLTTTLVSASLKWCSPSTMTRGPS